MRSAKQLIAELDAEFKAAEWEAEEWSESCFINALLVIAKVPENDVIHAGSEHPRRRPTGMSSR